MPDEAPEPRPTIPRYEIQGVLGRGGFATVYRAWDSVLERTVAIKVPYRHRIVDAADRERFLSEARLAARLRHPGAVVVYDSGLDSDGRCYVVFEYVPGRTLREVLQRETLPPRKAAELLAGVADTLQAAHKEGLVHRDLKPSNILLDNDGRPRVADFGLAIDERKQRELAGEICGTPEYMAPEQIRGEAHRLDGRTDIWAIGIMLYEMLVGRRPFNGDNADEIFDEVQHREPKPLRQIDDQTPRALEAICLQCLAKQLPDRYATAGDVAEDLRNWLNNSSRPSIGPSAAAEPMRGAEPTSNSISRPTGFNSRVLAICLVGAAILPALAAGAFLGRSLWLPQPAPGSGSPTTLQPAPENGPNASGPSAAGDLSYAQRDPADLRLQVWYPLLGQEPPRKLFWPAGDGNSEVTFNRERQQLSLICSGWGALSLGSVSQREYTLQLEVFRAEWAGDLGLFFGSHVEEDPAGSFTKMQALSLTRRPLGLGQFEYELERSVFVIYPPGHPKVGMRTIGLSRHQIPDPAQVPHMLEISIRDDSLVQVRWDGLPLPELCAPPETRWLKAGDYSGECGLFAKGATGIFRNARIMLNR